MTQTLAPALDQFLLDLSNFDDLPGVFNPWKHVDPKHDLGPRSPETRLQNLRSYLAARVGVAKIVLCAEALGFQGGHFSGIAMTSERILVGNLAHEGVVPADVFNGAGAHRCRTSRSGPGSARVLGFNEPTATIVWKAIKQHCGSTRDVVLWNAFAFHPMRCEPDVNDCWLSNRKPTRAEVDAGKPVLASFLALFPGAQVAAVGKVAEATLADLGVKTSATLRHPANGGAPAFRRGFGALQP